MPTRVPGHGLPGFPSCPAWTRPAIFFIVLMIVLSLVSRGYTAESAMAVVVMAATAASEVVRRLLAPPGEQAG